MQHEWSCKHECSCVSPRDDVQREGTRRPQWGAMAQGLRGVWRACGVSVPTLQPGTYINDLAGEILLPDTHSCSKMHVMLSACNGYAQRHCAQNLYIHVLHLTRPMMYFAAAAAVAELACNCCVELHVCLQLSHLKMACPDTCGLQCMKLQSKQSTSTCSGHTACTREGIVPADAEACWAQAAYKAERGPGP